MEKIGTITVKLNCGAHVARYLGQNATASSTAGELQSAHKCADKVHPDGIYKLEKQPGTNAYNVMKEV